MRNLVSVQIVKAVDEIPGADNIECITVLGWKLVAAKGEFHVGDKCVYFEVDSFLPLEDKYSFLLKSSYLNDAFLGEGIRIRTQTRLGQISQGLAMPLDAFGLDDNTEVGTDLTDRLHVRKWERPERISDFGKLLKGLPDDIPETDETRIQTIYDDIIPEFEGKEYYISTKINGTSVTFFIRDGKFGICSHCNEVVLDPSVPSSLWDYAKKHDIEDKMRAAGLDNIAIQGELAGEGIQKNQLRIKGFKWFVFTIKDLSSGRRLGLREMQEICGRVGLETVPIEEIGENLSSAYPTLNDILERAKGLYPSGLKKEGIVIRPTIPCESVTLGTDLSFKVLNNDFLLKEK